MNDIQYSSTRLNFFLSADDTNILYAGKHLQKRALRFIYFAKLRDHAIPFFLDAGILPISFLYYENICILMHDVRHEKHLRI